MKRVGHGGTLDPAATGVLPIALGKATRLLQFLRADKAYHATIRLGMQTSTDDLEGEVIKTHPAPWLELEKVEAELSQFQGKIQQIPPSYSAIQVNGKRLYQLARSGEVVEAPVRSVEVYQLEVLAWRSGEFPEIEVAISCGAGTYIRSIARDLGNSLGVGGTLARLIRTASSSFSLETSLTLEDLAEQVANHTFEPISPQAALSHLAAIDLTSEQTQRWNRGQKLIWDASTLDASALNEIALSQGGEEPIFYRVQTTPDRFLGIASVVQQEQLMLVPKLVWDGEG